MPIDKSLITREMLDKAMNCNTAEELIALAKTKGIDITKAEAEAYLNELEDTKLDLESLEKVAGGMSYDDSDTPGQSRKKSTRRKVLF